MFKIFHPETKTVTRIPPLLLTASLKIEIKVCEYETDFEMFNVKWTLGKYFIIFSSDISDETKSQQKSCFSDNMQF